MQLTSGTAVYGSARVQSLGAMLRRTASRSAEKTALICGAGAWSYGELDRLSDSIARGLVATGIAPEDRVAVMARNTRWFVALRFGVARAGAVLVPINYMLTVEDAAFILSDCSPKMIFTDLRCAHVVQEAVARAGISETRGLPDAMDELPALPSIHNLIAESDPLTALPAVDDRSLLQILYTSGTESRPKGAVLTHGAVLWQIQSAIHGCDWRNDAIVINALPLFHCAQLDGFMAPALSVGATNVILATPSPDQLANAIRQHHATSLFCPPTVWIDLLGNDDDGALSTLTHGYYGAAIMPVEVLRELRARVPRMRLWNCYGQTEIACIATLLQPDEQDRKIGSAGRAVLHVETRVVDEAMHDVSSGEIGEVVHRSPQLMSHYWNSPELTAAAFTGDWFHSGDLATIDGEGYITIVDRKKDVIKTGGENVSSREVEEVLYALPGVSEAAVIGVSHERWIEAVTAVIVPRVGFHLSESDVIAHCRDRLASYKRPKSIIFVDALPRNASGKILKRELRFSICETRQ